MVWVGSPGLGEDMVSNLGFDPSHCVIWGQLLQSLLKIEYTTLVSRVFHLNVHWAEKVIQNRNILTINLQNWEIGQFFFYYMEYSKPNSYS